MITYKELIEKNNDDAFLKQTAKDYDMSFDKVKEIYKKDPKKFNKNLELYIKDRKK